jgi:ATP-binding cassette subfamily F protein uup
MDVVQEIAEVIILADGSQITAGQFLNRFLFPPEMQYVQVEKLSGGEKRRLYLMTILMKNPNFLILDEPTNDFDIVTLNILEEYLLKFGGCLIIVSHDRFFMDKVVNHLFIFEGDGAIYDFPGNYSDYRVSQKQQEIESKRNDNQSELKNINITQAKIVNAKKKLTFRDKIEIEKLDSEIESLEIEKKILEADLSSGILNAAELISKSQRIAEIINLLEDKTDRWIALSDQN